MPPRQLTRQPRRIPQAVEGALGTVQSRRPARLFASPASRMEPSRTVRNSDSAWFPPLAAQALAAFGDMTDNEVPWDSPGLRHSTYRRSAVKAFGFHLLDGHVRVLCVTWSPAATLAEAGAAGKREIGKCRRPDTAMVAYASAADCRTLGIGCFLHRARNAERPGEGGVSVCPWS